jgi:hypothetical protein
MNKLKMINEIESLYYKALHMLDETETLVPTFKIISHSIAYNAISGERKICEIILKSTTCPSITSAVELLMQVPDTENEIAKIETVFYRNDKELSVLYDRHLTNCLKKMKTRHERVRQMVEAYY